MRVVTKAEKSEIVVPDVVPAIEHKEKDPDSDLDAKEKASLKRQKSILKNQKLIKEQGVGSRSERSEESTNITSAETTTS